jgi:hypothetical protein
VIFPHFQIAGYVEKEKITGQKEICPTFSHCARLVIKIFRANFPKFLSSVYYNLYIGGRGDEDIFDYYIAYFPQY